MSCIYTCNISKIFVAGYLNSIQESWVINCELNFNTMAKLIDKF